jgi:hypothetical protein
MIDLRRVLIYVLSLPFFVVFVGFDIVKAPIILVVCLPLVGLLDLIGLLRGEDSIFLATLGPLFFLGTTVWMDMVGVERPRWLE